MKAILSEIVAEIAQGRLGGFEWRAKPAVYGKPCFSWKLRAIDVLAAGRDFLLQRLIDR